MHSPIGVRHIVTAAENDGRDGENRSAFGSIAGHGRRFMSEPLLHFFIVGAVLFGLGQWHKSATDARQITVTSQTVAQLRTQYRMQFGDDPTPASMAQLVSRYVDDEVLYREGLAMGMDRDDEIVRRRIIQKMQFLEQDRTAPPEPSAAEIDRFYAAHLAQYAMPEGVTFTHMFFSPDKGGDQAARSRAAQALAALGNSPTSASGRGDNFPDLRDYSDFTQEQALRLFGDTQLAQVLFTVPAGTWSGPFKSAYGWHLIYVEARTPARTPPLAEIRDRVRSDVMTAAEAQLNRRRFDALKARYTIARDDLQGSAR